MMNITQRNEH